VPKADTLEQNVLDHLFGLATWTAPSPIYFALYTSAPSDSGGGTEVSGGSYARVAVTPSASTFTRSGSTVTNDSAITFPAATASWGTVTHVGILTAASGGSLLIWGPLSQARPIVSGDTFSLPANTGFSYSED
jgi:hypothetical protein